MLLVFADALRQQVMFRGYLLFVVQALVCSAETSKTGCDSKSGPAGAVECLRHRVQEKPEWTTCLTDAYIKQNSGGKYGCQNKTDIYCQYRCSLETRNLGPAVASNCTCNPNAPIPQNNWIPSSCYSPSGASCDWYENCLEKRYPCRSHAADYAVKYAKRFCQLYDQSYHRFTQSGKQWINAVRKCLQVSLVPLLRPWQKPTCSKLQTIAFGSHTCCYTGGAACSLPGSPSICSLSPFDWWRVFWTIKSAFVLSTTSAAESLKGVLGTMRACGTDLIRGRQDVAQVQLSIRPAVAQVGTSASMDSLALETGNLIAKKMNWETSNIDWFAYAVRPNSINLGKPAAIRILIANKMSPGLFGFKSINTAALLQRKVNELAKAVEGGSLKSEDKNLFTINTVQDCLDFTCDSVSLTAKAPSRGNKIAMDTAIAVAVMPLVLITRLMHE